MRLLVLCMTMISLGAQANEIRVLSGGAAKGFIDPLSASFAGARVRMEYQPMGRLTRSLAEGHPADMIVVTSEVLESLKLKGTPIARVGIGVAVHETAPLPDISNAAAFKRTLLAAKSVVYIDPKTGTSGKHVLEVIRKLNIEAEMRAKTTLGQGGYVTEPVGRGEIELGIHQISEILPVKGAKLAGPLPPELQKYTVYVAVNLKDSPVVQAFIDYLNSPQASARLAAAGYTSPR
jgi:molybdate transport system substrate-binding protein